MPSTQRKDLDATSALITVTVQRDELKPKVDAELKRFRQRAAIKGFRQGQAPMDYIKRMYGNALFADTLNDMMAQELYEYLRQSGLDVLGQPMPTENPQNFSHHINNPDTEYSVEYEVGFVQPFEVKGLDKNQVYERYAIADLDQLADSDLDNARQRVGKRTHPENDIQENDIVNIAAQEEGGDYATSITLFVKDLTDEAFKAELLTKKKGDTVRFNARELENRHEEKMYRKYILNLEESDDRKVGDWFGGVIEEVSRVGKAELDEEFFSSYFGGAVSNETEARDQIKKGIAQFYEVRANALVMRDMQARLLELNPVELPERFLRRWLLATNRDTLTPDSIEREFPAFAENLRWSLIRDNLKVRFGIEIGEEEIRAEYGRRIRGYFQFDLPENILADYTNRMMKNEKDVEKVKSDLEYDKLFDAMREAVTLSDKPIPSAEFQQIFDAVNKKAEDEQSEDAELREIVE
ncbi:MAG: trigger factor [Saprospiraceae bacterium]|nr:trigger factor [Saprospiraceae bacterium]